MAEHYEVLVLGVGNILWADEGFGVRCAEAFHKKFKPHPSVRVIDGGTLGPYLINELMSAKRLLIFDCCDFKAEAGTMDVLRDADIKQWSSTKISAHQGGLNDVLATAALQGYVPEAIAVVGVQPLTLDDYGGSLTQLVAEKLDEALDLAQTEMASWGITLQPRAPDEPVEPLADHSLELADYEEGRPDSREACRIGDVRFFPKKS